MDNWKIVNRIAFVFGIVLAVFAVVAALTSYELDTALYLPSAPAKLFYISALTAALPFIVGAILSFALQILTSSATIPEAEQEDEERAKQEAEEKARREAEEQAEQEIAFEETKKD